MCEGCADLVMIGERKRKVEEGDDGGRERKRACVFEEGVEVGME